MLFQRDSGLVSRLMPSLSLLVATLASVIPLHLPGFAVVTPAFALVVAYHWSIYRPDIMPYAAVFVAGLLLDLLNGAPLGVSPLALLVARGLVMSQRRHVSGHGFAVVWAGFVVVAAAFFAVEWLVVSLFYGLALDLRPFLFQAVLTISAYPPVSYLLVRLQRSFLMRV